MQNPAEMHPGEERPVLSPSQPLDGDSFSLEVPEAHQAGRSSKISNLTLSDTPGQANELPVLEDSCDSESQGGESDVDGGVDVLMQKTSGVFTRKMKEMAVELNEEIQMSLRVMRETQAHRNNEVNEQLCLLQGVNEHTKVVTSSLAMTQDRHTALSKKYEEFVQTAEGALARAAKDKADLFQKIAQMEQKLLELKNQMAAVELNNFQKEMEQQKLEQALGRAKRRLREEVENQVGPMRVRVQATEHKLKQEESASQEWKQLYEELMKKFNAKLEKDLEARKKALEKATEAKAVITEQMEELERLKAQLGQSEGLREQESSEMKGRIKEMEGQIEEMRERHLKEMKEERKRKEELETHKRLLEEKLAQRDQEIAGLMVLLEEREQKLKEQEETGAQRAREMRDVIGELERENGELKARKEQEKAAKGEKEAGETAKKCKCKHPDYELLLERIEELTQEAEEKSGKLEGERARRLKAEAEGVALRQKLEHYETTVAEREFLSKRMVKVEEENRDLYARLIEITNRLVVKDNELDVTHRYVFELKQQLQINNSLMKEVAMTPKVAASTKKNAIYKTTDPTDEVDRKFSEIINFTDCPVPITRLGNGVYLFGNRRIKATMQGGRLVIRVGGGFMVVEEFVQTYGHQEFMKMQQLALKQENGKSRQKSLTSTFSSEQTRSLSKDCIKSPFGLNKVKSKPSIARVDTAEMRRATVDNYRCFETPLKSERHAKKNKLLELSQGSSKRMMSQVDLNIHVKAARDTMLGGEEMVVTKKKKKGSLVDATFTEGMMTSLVDENMNPKQVRDKYKKVKVDASINGSARVRNLNKTEKDAIIKYTGSGCKKTKDRALKGISKSMMIHDRKFSTSEEVEECGALYQYEEE